MNDPIAPLRSLLFCQNGLAPDFAKYLLRVIPKDMDWGLLELDNLALDKQLLGIGVLLYDIVCNKLENIVSTDDRKKEQAERIAHMIMNQHEGDKLYAWLWSTIHGHYKELLRKRDPFKRFYHKIQIKIAAMKPDTGIFPLELHKGNGKTHYSKHPSPLPGNVYDEDSASFHTLRPPTMPLEYLLPDVYASKQIRSAILVPLANFYHDDIVTRWQPFAGQPCFIGIGVFARWLSVHFPDMEGELRQKKGLDKELAVTISWVEDFSLHEEIDVKLFDGYCASMWDKLPSKYRPVVCAMLENWLSPEGCVTDTTIANAIGYSPQRFKYVKDKLLDPDESSGLLRDLWKPCLVDFLEKMGESHLLAFLVYFYEYCKNSQRRLSGEQEKQ